MSESGEQQVVLLVTYTLRRLCDDRMQEATVTIPASIAPQDIPMAVKQKIRPKKAPDPSDNYRGQQPSDVTIVNLVNLSKLE
jgi:hypothetical protein